MYLVGDLAGNLSAVARGWDDRVTGGTIGLRSEVRWDDRVTTAGTMGR